MITKKEIKQAGFKSVRHGADVETFTKKDIEINVDGRGSVEVMIGNVPCKNIHNIGEISDILFYIYGD